jgi:hypothetical protein
VHRQQTEPLIHFYEAMSILRTVNAERPIDVISKELDRMFPKKPKADGDKSTAEIQGEAGAHESPTQTPTPS